ncbi:MAG: hypothetical protein HYT79_05555 [Elusimicrobia bacterium]|nr:hypothetical protein [Elusimicrobiota bacterium]
MYYSSKTGLTAVLLPLAWALAAILSLLILDFAFKNIQVYQRVFFIAKILSMGLPLAAILGLGLGALCAFWKKETSIAPYAGMALSVIILMSWAFARSSLTRAMTAREAQIEARKIAYLSRFHLKNETEDSKRLLREKLDEFFRSFNAKESSQMDACVVAVSAAGSLLAYEDEGFVKTIDESLNRIKTPTSESSLTLGTCLLAFHTIMFSVDVGQALRFQQAGDMPAHFEHWRHALDHWESGQASRKRMVQAMDRFMTEERYLKLSGAEQDNLMQTVMAPGYEQLRRRHQPLLEHIKTFFVKYNGDENFKRAADNLYQGRHAAAYISREQAEKLYRKSVEQFPDFGNAHIELGMIYADKGEPKTALDYFEKGLNLIERHGSQDLNPAKTMLSSGYYQAAKAWLALANRKETKEDQKKIYRKTADQLLVKSLRIDPKNAEVRQLRRFLSAALGTQAVSKRQAFATPPRSPKSTPSRSKSRRLAPTPPDAE